MEAEKVGPCKYTKTKQKDSDTHCMNSAIFEHVARANYVIGWGGQNC